MGQSFKEVAHLRTDKEKFDEGWDRIFGQKKEQVSEAASEVQEESVGIDISKKESSFYDCEFRTGIISTFNAGLLTERDLHVIADAFVEFAEEVRWLKANFFKKQKNTGNV